MTCENLTSVKDGVLKSDSTDATRSVTFETREVIEISSGEDSDFDTKVLYREQETPIKMPGAWSLDNSVSPVKTASSAAKLTTRTPIRRPAARRIVMSSESEASDTEIIVISDSSPEMKSRAKSSKQLEPAVYEEYESLYADDSEHSDNDSAIMIFDEPKSTRKPIKISRDMPSASLPSTPQRKTGGNIVAAASIQLTLPSKLGAQSRSARQPRISKKAQAEADLMRRKAYAEELFKDLNETVFKDALPKDTQLNWSKRLLTTAGRARWHHKNGIHTTEIELAEKILDCDERIRNTLSHEMCHLACWIIDENPKEVHGRLFKKWSAKVMHRYPVIEITLRHDYEISYPYNWECEQCAKTYGRFSRSIRPDECVCGACKVGKLVPLFSVAKRVPKTPKTSRMAADKPNDSPMSVARIAIDIGEVPTLPRSDKGKSREILSAQESSSGFESNDSDVEILATVFASVTLTQ
ncbi:hypothetical protein HGRIS_007383 [Hohenbuehelia grisea]|uniref:SprT-like domain-containing protein n=1 Tax=Hohenbuehelia grisea TaxID=104357 RepID=A0ABR3J5E7_9AGAR